MTSRASIAGTRRHADERGRLRVHVLRFCLARGDEIDADIWFRCYGVVPNSDYLGEELAKARLANGHLEVTPELRLAGQETVFAIGDLTAIPEAKRGGAAGRHAEVAAGNIRTLIEGGDDLASYQPAPPLILLPLGPSGGVSQLPGQSDFGGPVDLDVPDIPTGT